MSFGQEFVTLFSGMTWVVVACLITGLIFITIELFQPGFGVFGILGGILIVLGLAFRLAKGDGNPLAQLFIMLFFLTVIIGSVFLIMIKTMKKGWLSKTPFVENGTAVSEIRSDGTIDYSFLVGKVGISLTTLRPSGKAEIEGGEYDVTASSFFIQKDEPIVVISTEGVKISVKRAE